MRPLKPILETPLPQLISLWPVEDLTPDPDHFDDSELLNPDAGDAEVTPEVGETFSMLKSCSLVLEL